MQRSCDWNVQKYLLVAASLSASSVELKLSAVSRKLGLFWPASKKERTKERM
jgi:hypothetical protein